MLKGIQPTYEELKPFVIVKRSGTGTGIQPTYEELKRLSVPTVPSSDSGIQPTYEELKPRARAWDFLCCSVSSLPMRN